MIEHGGLNVAEDEPLVAAVRSDAVTTARADGPTSSQVLQPLDCAPQMSHTLAEGVPEGRPCGQTDGARDQPPGAAHQLSPGARSLPMALVHSGQWPRNGAVRVRPCE